MSNPDRFELSPEDKKLVDRHPYRPKDQEWYAERGKKADALWGSGEVENNIEDKDEMEHKMEVPEPVTDAEAERE